ncbi:T9SS type A sorting domain-containing protein [Brumimicrobium glaciale]|uniref:T9SS type A sorting domain-containing protein n=1 Tax=Brumimicrobium glaciale TaxID=200475 RepID=A0A4Q4KHK3_9FLAO|nr:T9SS type A sorting domain-containing protein [Brumimicrobium glaciale]RYM32097.1 T9SS type A sorting domain-containing protein [Brumimicrobium glaciale]
MKLLKTLLIAFAILFVNYSIAQIHSSILDHNNVSASISDAGTFCYDYTNQGLGYEVPKGSGRHAIYSTQFWFAAIDAQGEIHFVQGGVPNQGTDVFNGPISDPGTYTNPEYQNKWNNSVWSICQTDIDNFVLTYECGLDPNCDEVYPLTNEAIMTINNWPAHGDDNSGQSYYLAEYFDYDSDGSYNPMAGDYPIIKGCCATYMIQNDAAEPHSYTNTNVIGIEMHYLFYQYKTWDYLNDVTFVDITVINRSNTNYPEFIHSIAVDADIGNSTDDYYGCDSLNNLTYFYNADNDDEDHLQTLGYGVNPPAIGIVSLNNDMTSSVPYADAGLTVSNKWNLMNGLKADGSSWLNPNAIATKYVFSGNPNIPSEWSALSVGHQNFEAKSLTSVNVGSFNIGDTLKQSYAITYARNGNHLENVQSVIDRASDVKDFYINESDIPCTDGTTNLEKLEDFNVSISPNPSSGIVNINNYDKNPLSITVLDLQGKVLLEKPFTSESKIEIDLRDQRSGIYFFHLRTESGSLVRKIVIR